MADSPSPFAGSPSGPDAPLPLTAVYQLSTGALQLTLSEPVQANPSLSILNWFLRIGPNRRTVTSASAVASSVLIATSPGPVDPGPQVISFSPPPFDVLSVPGMPMLAFAGFPVTTIP